MKKVSFTFIAMGVLIACASAIKDIFRLNDNEKLGAVQMLGIDIGILSILIGIVIFSLNNDWDLRKKIRKFPEQVLQIAPKYWILSTFLVLYVLFFLSPMFFSKIKIQYFVRYIPYEWVEYIGNDIVWTVEHIEQWFILGRSPFSSFFYPPMTVYIFAPLIILGYPAYYKLTTIITFLSYIITSLLIPAFISSKKNGDLVLLFFISGLFSYGLQFEMDRGQFNMIAFAACFLAIYLFHYHPRLWCFSYLLFSLSVQLKMYPIIFIFMFIKDWREWLGNLKRVLGLLLFNILLLFVLGVQVFVDFVRNLASAQLYFQSSRREDLSITGFVLNLAEDGLGVIHPSLISHFASYSKLIEMFFLVIFAVCLCSVLVFSYKQNYKGLNVYLLVICTLGALIIPSASVDYKLPLLVGPIAILLSNLPDLRTYAKKVLLIVVTIIMSIAYWSTLYPFTIKPYILSRNFPALFTILISVTLLYFLVEGKSEVHNLET
jgi:hypothetical protein